jgi:hypothetical protein
MPKRGIEKEDGGPSIPSILLDSCARLRGGSAFVTREAQGHAKRVKPPGRALTAKACLAQCELFSGD